MSEEFRLQAESAAKARQLKFIAHSVANLLKWPCLYSAAQMRKAQAGGTYTQARSTASCQQKWTFAWQI